MRIILLVGCFVFYINKSYAMAKKMPLPTQDFRQIVKQQDGKDFVQCFTKIALFIKDHESYSRHIYPDGNAYSVGYGDQQLAAKLLHQGKKSLPKGNLGILMATDSMLNRIYDIVFNEIPRIEKFTNAPLYRSCTQLIAITSRLYQQGQTSFSNKKVVGMIKKHYNTCSIAKTWVAEMPHVRRAIQEAKLFASSTKCHIKTSV